MKFLKYMLFASTAILIISACQKELSFDVDGNAKGTLKSDVTGECLPSTVNGIYKADSVLNNTNFIDVQVNLTSTGAYDIKSDTVNGYSFRGTGTFGITGLNTVRLYATGQPLLAGTDAFTITFDNSTCVVNVIVIGPNTGIAVYTLSGAPGTCSGAVINGTYTVGTALGIDNTVTLTVNVTSPGTYTLAAASVNGMLFTATGLFPNAGIQSVTLNGTGLPLADGNFNATASNGASNCTFTITVDPSSSGGAVYSLDAVTGTCSGATSTGTYTAGTALNATNIILLNVTVVSTGTYSITTNTDNGISFTGTGTFLTTGAQPVALTGSGTPVTAGTYNYTATATPGTSTCTFSVIINSVAPPANLDYLPQTAFSNWSDKLVGGAAGDTSYVQVSPNSIIKNGITYSIFEVKETGTAVDSFFYRKNGGQYYQLYDDSYGFDNPFNADGLLLDSTQNVNATWIINLGSNSISGVPATAKINCTMIGKGATATIAGNSYTNIIKVTYAYVYNAGAGDNTYAVEEIWYAKGKGVIYYKVNDQPVTFTDVYETTRIQIF